MEISLDCSVKVKNEYVLKPKFGQTWVIVLAIIVRVTNTTITFFVLARTE